MSGEQYDADYFLRGKATGKSLYEDYRWMPEMTLPMVRRIIDHCGIVHRDHILDFGCARGYVVRAFMELLYSKTYGYDASGWAISNCDLSVIGRVSSDLTTLCCEHNRKDEQDGFDWIIAKDVLEHIEFVDLLISDLMGMARRGVFVVVPLSLFDGTPYVIEDYERDVTHVQRKTLMTWAKMFVRPGWRVEVSYRVPGIKDNWYRPGWEKGNGFITARRITEA